MKVIIVGGSAGGASVAARLRRLDEAAEIILIDKSDHISFATCGIPYYIGGVISDRDRLNVIEKEEFSNMLNVDLRTQCEVMAIDRDSKKVLVRKLSNGALYEETYDKLVLAPGGTPVRPNIEGIHSDNVITLRSAEDTDYAYEYINTKNCQNILIVGAGFIGLELAENLQSLGYNVHIAESFDQVMGAWDYEIAAQLHQHLRAKGVNLILADEVTRITPDGAHLSSGLFVMADAIFLCIGIKPNSQLAQQCDIETGVQGAIKVNQGMLTSDEHIYALGDAVEVQNTISNEQTLIPLAGVAQRQARIVADNLCDRHRSFKGSQGSAIAKVFDLAIGITGLSERQLNQKNINYKKTYIETSSHAGFYPDAFPMIIKLLFTGDTGQILGAQIIGAHGVDKRLDVIATAMTFGGTVYDLADTDLAYAPPFSSAKDPVNLVAMTAVNLMENHFRAVYWDELDAAVANGALLLDVRTEVEFELRHLEGAINIPLAELRKRIHELPLNKPIIVFCQQGKKGYFAARLLSEHGFHSVRNLSGGLKIYQLASQERNWLSTQSRQTFAEDIAAGESKLHHLNSNVSYLQLEEDIEDKRCETAEPIDTPIVIDASGLSCPGPIMHLTKEVRTCNHDDVIKITATDTGFAQDVKTWISKSGHKLIKLSVNANPGTTCAYIRINKQADPQPEQQEKIRFNDITNDDVFKKEPIATKLLNFLNKVPDESEFTARNFSLFDADDFTPATDLSSTLTIDACGLNCPGPIMKLTKAARGVTNGETITITATDIDFQRDISTWANKKGFRLVNLDNSASKITAVLQKL